MATIRLNGNGTVTIRVQALNALEISGGVIKKTGPGPAPVIVGDHPSVGIVEWQISADTDSAYLLMVEMPKLHGISINQHRIKRTISQNGVPPLLPASANPKTTKPQNTLPNDHLLYHEVVKFD